ncbi:hypothetical protein [Polaribacter sp. R77954]|uniref:hypothetical protein n=1 Tax=Polaribacter sp. R77954 TaxID=3093870 RepID=UPI0037C9F279
MKKIAASLLFFCIWFTNAQQKQEDTITMVSDTIAYTKTTEITKERNFSTNLKEKYSGKDFQYKENSPKKKKTSNNGFFDLFAFFMTTIFPFLLGGFVIFVIVKVLLGSDLNFWKSNKSSPKTAEKLIYEDEDIHEINLEALLQKAIDNKDFRLAIRYYYLSALKSLSQKQLIDYHKDKTNSEYLFEIENISMRTQFSYLSYVYSYVWYGEFPVDETNFKVAENKYQSFLKSIV